MLHLGAASQQQSALMLAKGFMLTNWQHNPYRHKDPSRAVQAILSAGTPLRNFLRAAIFWAHANILSKVVRVAWSDAVVTDLQTKVEKYETKAAQSEERARQATDGPQRAFYEVLAQYYGEVATDFRQVIEKRKAA
jgi:hypothetical protein